MILYKLKAIPLIWRIKSAFFFVSEWEVAQGPKKTTLIFGSEIPKKSIFRLFGELSLLSWSSYRWVANTRRRIQQQMENWRWRMKLIDKKKKKKTLPRWIKYPVFLLCQSQFICILTSSMASTQKNYCLLRQIRCWRGNSTEKYERFHYRSYLFLVSKAGISEIRQEISVWLLFFGGNVICPRANWYRY